MGRSTEPPVPSEPITPNWLKSGGLAPVPLSRDQRSDPWLSLRELQCFALGLSELVYQYNLEGLERVLTREGLDHFQGFNPGLDPGGPGFGFDQSKIGMGFRRDRRAWVVFRGSDDALDWDTNFQLSKTAGNIHSGFWNAWRRLRDGVLDWVSKLGGEVDEVVVTGHSLGGALAVLAAREISEHSRLPIRAVFTFGAPRVGGEAFVKDYDQRDSHFREGSLPVPLGAVTWQMRNATDIVPKVPLRVLGYRHCGQAALQLWPANIYTERYYKEQWGELPESLEVPAILIPETAGQDILKTVVKMLSSLMPLLELLFGALKTAGDSGLSHRMKEYRPFFGRYTSFWQATDREPEVVEAIQPQKEESSLPWVQATTSAPERWLNPFERERTQGWTKRLTLAVAAGLGAIGSFVFLLIASVQLVREDVRWMGYLLIVLSLISFASWVKRRL
ncbi:MAG: lipase family protein [Acidobacteriota bacterium]